MTPRFVLAWVVACAACESDAVQRDAARVDTDDVTAETEVAAADSAAVDSVSETDSAAVDSAIETDGAAVDSASETDGAAVDSAIETDSAAVDSAIEADSAAVDSAIETDTGGGSDLGPDGGGLCGGAAPACSARRPVILVHGINGGPENFDVMAARLIAAGWPEDQVVRFDAADPSWGCNVDNAAAIAALVEDVRARTCQGKVDIVAHSMGTLSSRYYLKDLGGTAVVNTYVTLGGMHHGLLSPCFAPDFLGVCVWTELCAIGAFITGLNADPATPGPTRWVSIYGTADETVGNDSSHLDGAENIAIEGAEHDGPNGLLQREDAFAEVLRALGDPCW